MFKIGIDEAGRGPWAGPVYVGLVILNQEQEKVLISHGVKDSKKLSEKKRIDLIEIIKYNSLFSTTHSLNVNEIDEIGVHQSIVKGIREILKQVPGKYQIRENVFIDGYFCEFKDQLKCIINGDSLEVAISAASILAKVARDFYMKELDKSFPQYQFARHKGYGTNLHMEMLKKFGICEHHRESFKPIRSVLSPKTISFEHEL